MGLEYTALSRARLQAHPAHPLLSTHEPHTSRCSPHLAVKFTASLRHSTCEEAALNSSCILPDLRARVGGEVRPTCECECAWCRGGGATLGGGVSIAPGGWGERTTWPRLSPFLPSPPGPVPSPPPYPLSPHLTASSCPIRVPFMAPLRSLSQASTCEKKEGDYLPG